MPYKITVSQEGEPYKDTYDRLRTDWKTVYEQSVDNLDVAALAIYINSLPKVRSHKKKEETQ